jgi:hypothetical protein
MADELKSSYELALERLKRKDASSGEAAPAALTAAQKKKIAAIRKEYEAKLAEREILFAAEKSGSDGDPEKLALILDGFRRDSEFLTSRQDAAIAAVRKGKD